MLLRTLENGVKKIKTIGDAFMATAGLLTPAENPTLNSVRCGLDMIAGLEHIKSPWNIRVGIHIGPVMAGVVGRRTFVFDVWGDTVNTAERIEGNGTPGRVTVSAAAWEHVSAHCHGISLGSVPMKGIGDPWGYAEPSLKRVHRRIFRLNDKIDALEKEVLQTSAELEYHRSINEDAQRDAAVGNYIDREEAGLTSADVRRFEKTIADLDAKREKLETKRDNLLATLPE